MVWRSLTLPGSALVRVATGVLFAYVYLAIPTNLQASRQAFNYELSAYLFALRDMQLVIILQSLCVPSLFGTCI